MSDERDEDLSDDRALVGVLGGEEFEVGDAGYPDAVGGVAEHLSGLGEGLVELLCGDAVGVLLGLAAGDA